MKTPFVSLVTPFYNTASYLKDCIESVLAQTWTDWEYVLLDNCSTDGSREIAEHYAALEPRIRLERNAELLGQVDNYNRALSLISPESEYCLLVQADDWIMPECVERMVRLAETDASIGVVTSYHLEGTQVRGEGVPATVSVLDGREVCRKTLLGQLFVFGSPTTVMYRSAIVREREEFFDCSKLHEDTDALFRTLKTWNLGFVHQVLSFVRLDEESISGRVRALAPFMLDAFLRSRMYADEFLAPDEAAAFKRRAETNYLKLLAAGCLGRHRREMLAYHRRGLETIGYQIPRWRLASFVLWELLDWLGNPKRTISRVLRGRSGRDYRAVSAAGSTARFQHARSTSLKNRAATRGRGARYPATCRSALTRPHLAACKDCTASPDRVWACISALTCRRNGGADRSRSHRSRRLCSSSRSRGIASGEPWESVLL